MLYLPIETRTYRHAKATKLARLLSIETPCALGHLVTLWLWSLETLTGEAMEAGDLSGMADEEIAAAAGWRGDPSQFVTAMRECRWLDADGTIHDWRQYVGPMLETRRHTAERMQKWRDAKKAKAPLPPVAATETRPPSQWDKDIQQAETQLQGATAPPVEIVDGMEVGQPAPRRHRGRVHNPDIRTECVPVPAKLNTPAFHAAWKEWHEYQQERGNPITQATARGSLNELEKYDAAGAIAVILYSKRQGYTGLVPPKEETAQTLAAPAARKPVDPSLTTRVVAWSLANPAKARELAAQHVPADWGEAYREKVLKTPGACGAYMQAVAKILEGEK